MVSIQQQLRDVDAVAAEVLDVADRAEAKKEAGSRREAYEKSLRAAKTIAGRPAAGELKEWIEDQIRTKEKFPTARATRKQAAKICRSMDHSIPDDSYLGA